MSNGPTDALVFTILVVGAIGGLSILPAQETADNPWGEQNLTVNVTTGENVSAPQVAQYDSALNATLAYWMDNDDKYGNYTANWSYVEGDADLTIRYVEEIDQCGWDFAILSEFTGCSPILFSNMTTDHEEIEIMANRPPDEVKRTLMHEFGHVYGLNHSSEPQPLMDGEVESYDG